MTAPTTGEAIEGGLSLMMLAWKGNGVVYNSI